MQERKSFGFIVLYSMWKTAYRACHRYFALVVIGVHACFDNAGAEEINEYFSVLWYNVPTYLIS